MERLKGKVAVVTGAGSGIGKVLARRLASDGASITVADVQKFDEAAAEIAKATGARTLGLQVDVSSENDVARMAAETVKAFGRIEARRRARDRQSEATRYIALSRPLTPEKLLSVTRAYWSIENQLHWTLDVVFDEDDARTRKDYGPENSATIRRWALNILRMHPAQKSISRKMRQASWSKDFFFELFAHLR